MKKLIAFASMILAAATLTISCEGVKNEVEYFADLASLVDGTPESGNFYVIFDDGQKAYVTNSNQFTIPPQAYTDGEARAIIKYSIDGTKSGYNKSIKLADFFPIATNPIYIKTEKPLGYNSMKSSFNIKNAYIARDYINLGFSGSARGEEAICQYMASLDVSVFVVDYDHNAPSLEHLKATHYPLFKTFRDAHPGTPVVFVSKPDFRGDADSVARRAAIYETYRTAKENGDDNVYFIDGELLFAGEFRDSCTVDGCHPNDLGFFRMGMVIGEAVAKVLEK